MAQKSTDFLPAKPGKCVYSTNIKYEGEEYGEAFYYPQMKEAEKEEHFKNNGYPVYGQLMMNAIKFEELAGLISRKK